MKAKSRTMSAKEARRVLREIDGIERRLSNIRAGIEWTLRLRRWEEVQKDTPRLDWLIAWLGSHDDVSEMPVRDWNDAKDARKAIDQQIAREKRKGRE